jgi:hypothetical protein
LEYFSEKNKVFWTVKCVCFATFVK